MLEKYQEDKFTWETVDDNSTISSDFAFDYKSCKSNNCKKHSSEEEHIKPNPNKSQKSHQKNAIDLPLDDYDDDLELSLFSSYPWMKIMWFFSLVEFFLC